MAKEFKDFDDTYRKLMGKVLAGENGITLQIRAKEIEGWDYADEIVLWSNKEIREAVYESATADAWQQFRVSLKGFSTAMKLARLENRYLAIREKVRAAYEKADGERKMLALWEVYTESLAVEEIREKCRIDNYIGALRRGGQLDAGFRIRK